MPHQENLIMKTLMAFISGLLVVGCASTANVVGKYKMEGTLGQMVVLEDGKIEGGGGTWTVKDGEFHLETPADGTLIHSIKTNGDLVVKAIIQPGGKRTEVPKEAQISWKKID